MTYFNEEHRFDGKTCELFTKIIQQDDLNIKVLYYIAQCEKANIQVTAKSIADNVKAVKRTALRDNKNNIVCFSKEEGNIDRKKAEKIVERLEYATLIYFDIKRPFKFIKLTLRGAQIAINLKKMEANKK